LIGLLDLFYVLISKNRRGDMMGGNKVEQAFELNEDHVDWLKAMTEKYALDEGKALRIVLDYVMEEADQTTVFEEVRCNHCGDAVNQD